MLLPNFLEVNENRIREGDPNVAKDLGLAIYRELSCFQEACRLLDREAPPAAANEAVVSGGSAELLSGTRMVPSVHEVVTPMNISEQLEALASGTSAKRLPGPGDSSSPMRKKANLIQDSPTTNLLSKNTVKRLARSAKSKLYKPFQGNPDMPDDPNAMTD